MLQKSSCTDVRNPTGGHLGVFFQEQRELADAHSAKVNEAAWGPRRGRYPEVPGDLMFGVKSP